MRLCDLCILAQDIHIPNCYLATCSTAGLPAHMPWYMDTPTNICVWGEGALYMDTTLNMRVWERGLYTRTHHSTFVYVGGCYTWTHHSSSMCRRGGFIHRHNTHPLCMGEAALYMDTPLNIRVWMVLYMGTPLNIYVSERGLCIWTHHSTCTYGWFYTWAHHSTSIFRRGGFAHGHTTQHACMDGFIHGHTTQHSMCRRGGFVHGHTIQHTCMDGFIHGRTTQRVSVVGGEGVGCYTSTHIGGGSTAFLPLYIWTPLNLYVWEDILDGHTTQLLWVWGCYTWTHFGGWGDGYMPLYMDTPLKPWGYTYALYMDTPLNHYEYMRMIYTCTHHLNLWGGGGKLHIYLYKWRTLGRSFIHGHTTKSLCGGRGLYMGTPLNPNGGGITHIPLYMDTSLTSWREASLLIDIILCTKGGVFYHSKTQTCEDYNLQIAFTSTSWTPRPSKKIMLSITIFTVADYMLRCPSNSIGFAVGWPQSWTLWTDAGRPPLTRATHLSDINISICLWTESARAKSTQWLAREKRRKTYLTGLSSKIYFDNYLSKSHKEEVQCICKEMKK